MAMVDDKDDLLIKDFMSKHPIVIENDAFSECISLKAIAIPNSVTSIGD